MPSPPTSATVGNNTTIVAIAPAPSANHCSLPEFLGLPNIAKGAGGILQRLGSRLLSGLDLTGRFPELQPQPPVVPITDPANLEEGAPPAVQAAAEIKQEEDAAPQKIMAIRYLATLGCGGCYEKVEDALLEGLSDCTEEVRFEAVKALQCKPDCGCKYCSSPSCCSAKVRKRLLELTTCEKEPSARIRRMARQALACCNTKPLEEEEIPREGPPAPLSDVSSFEATAPSPLFDGIQLVSFQTPVSDSPTVDMLLATVNGESIFESHALALVEARMRASEELNPNDPIVRRKQLMQELTRLIDWKLIGQQYQNEMQVSSPGVVPISPGAHEIQSWFERRIHVDSQMTSQEILAHYEIHREKFYVPARARWERMTVKIDEYSSHEVAAAIAAYLRNLSLGKTSDPPSEFSKDKIDVQAHDWTEIANLKSTFERAALKQLPIGQVSNTVETDGCLHLLRVLERQEDSYLPLTSVVERIRADILRERKKAAELRLLALLRSHAQIWTVFDSPISPTKSSPVMQGVIPASTDWQHD